MVVKSKQPPDYPHAHYQQQEQLCLQPIPLQQVRMQLWIFSFVFHLRSDWYIALYPVRKYECKGIGKKVPLRLMKNKFFVKRHGVNEENVL